MFFQGENKEYWAVRRLGNLGTFHFADAPRLKDELTAFMYS